ncbi:MAG TPA: hypothetical protein VLE53_03055 [Gemmatimonadaceae bacterium]|nr:hypothetical protein [Gemmatimonadaceae bacterium]
MGTGLFRITHGGYHRPLVTAVSLFVLGCGTDGSTPLGPTGALLSDHLDEGRGRVVLVPDAHAPGWPSDPLTIGEVSIAGDTIRIGVSFGGGCREHRLQLLAETTWMESNPVQVHARVAHDAGGDACEALIHGTLHFDLAPLRRMYQAAYQTTTGRIWLRLAGAEGVIVYEF